METQGRGAVDPEPSSRSRFRLRSNARRRQHVLRPAQTFQHNTRTNTCPLIAAMIIRRGKAEGWLHLDLNALRFWATEAGVTFKLASPVLNPGRGTVLIAKENIAYPGNTDGPELLLIDEGLVLSQQSVKSHAQFDQDFREVLESVGDFGRVCCSFLAWVISDRNT